MYKQPYGTMVSVHPQLHLSLHFISFYSMSFVASKLEPAKLVTMYNIHVQLVYMKKQPSPDHAEWVLTIVMAILFNQQNSDCLINFYRINFSIHLLLLNFIGPKKQPSPDHAEWVLTIVMAILFNQQNNDCLINFYRIILLVYCCRGQT